MLTKYTFSVCYPKRIRLVLILISEQIKQQVWLLLCQKKQCSTAQGRAGLTPNWFFPSISPAQHPASAPLLQGIACNPNSEIKRPGATIASRWLDLPPSFDRLPSIYITTAACFPDLRFGLSKQQAGESRQQCKRTAGPHSAPLEHHDSIGLQSYSDYLRLFSSAGLSLLVEVLNRMPY